MPVVGAVITLDSSWHGLADCLRRDPRVQLSDKLPGGRVAVTVNTPDAVADRAFWQSLRQLAGVVNIEYARHHDGIGESK